MERRHLFTISYIQNDFIYAWNNHVGTVFFLKLWRVFLEVVHLKVVNRILQLNLQTLYFEDLFFDQ